VDDRVNKGNILVKNVILKAKEATKHLNTIQGYTLYHPLLNNSEAGREYNPEGFLAVF